MPAGKGDENRALAAAEGEEEEARRKAEGQEPRKHLLYSMSPPLPDDMIPEILLRVPPDDPASIVRASAVCKAWWRILADPAYAFTGRYREHHRRRTAPVLGFLHHPGDHEAPRFVPTTSFRLPTPDRHMRHVWDCCHGRVLLYDYDMRSATAGFVVWDPITGDQHHIPNVPDCFSNAALICTDSGGHRGCSGAPFIVAFVGVEYYGDYGRDAYGDLYLSETRKWNRNDNVHLYDAKFDLERDRPAAHVGDSLYFVGTSGILLRFWYGPLLRLGVLEMLYSGIYPSQTLTLIEPPAKCLGKVIVMTAEGGGLGLACLKRNRIALWARETKAGPKGDSDIWVKHRTIDLNRLIPLSNPKRLACLSGVIPGDANVIFVSTEDGVFKIKLGPSLQVRKVSEMGTDVKIIYPFVSFYTETLLQRLASSKLPASEGNM